MKTIYAEVMFLLNLKLFKIQEQLYGIFCFFITSGAHVKCRSLVTIKYTVLYSGHQEIYIFQYIQIAGTLKYSLKT